MIRKNIDEQVTLKADATFEDGKKIKGNIAFVTKDYNIEYPENEMNNSQYILGKEEFVVEVQEHKAKYVFIIKDLIDKLRINQNDIAYVKGWMDSDGDGEYTRLFDLKVFLQINNCYCNRDFTVDEVKSIIKELRDIEIATKGKYDLFIASNCDLLPIDKTYERFTEELNKTFNKYEINTCLRKIHFLAQAYHETSCFLTTEEYGDGNCYNPRIHKDAIKNGNTEFGDGLKYKGRGLMQLTWKINYQNYKRYTGVNIVNNYSMVSDNLEFACDTAGWFWRNGSAWLDLNPHADKDDIYYINIGVNGGANGFSQRIKYIKKLITDDKVKNCQNIILNKELGKYKLSTSDIKNTNYVKNNNSIKIRLEGYDD